MKLTVEIPEDISHQLAKVSGDLSRRALESFALEEFRRENLSEQELMRRLGFGTRWQLDGFLKAHGIYDTYTLEDFEQERQAIKSSGF